MLAKFVFLTGVPGEVLDGIWRRVKLILFTDVFIPELREIGDELAH
jgi:hypothetical protein